MKIGLPKFRRSRKLLVVTLGISVLLGGTAGAALYFKSKELGLERTASIVGGACKDVQTMVLKTPSNRLWLRRYIRMEEASGPDRVRTALRIAGLLAKKNAVDLIHVSVLDTKGPTVRSQMRSRAIGAEVVIAIKPENLPEMKSPAMASYYEGPISEDGRFYGDKVIVDIDEIGTMMSAMRAVEQKSDCEGTVELSQAKPTPGKKDAKPDHARTTGKEAETGGSDHAASESSDTSFLDTMMAMVGLSASDEAHSMSPAPARENDGASAEGHTEPAADYTETPPAETEEPVDTHSQLDSELDGAAPAGEAEQQTQVNMQVGH